MKHLTEYQQKLVENNLHIVSRTIKKLKISSLQTPEEKDLYQSGCLALCNAAISFNGQTKFSYYASIVIRNSLINILKQAYYYQSKTCYLDEPISDQENFTCYYEIIPSNENIERLFIENEICATITILKKNSSGTLYKGLNAIELYLQGFSTRDIAQKYKTTENNVTAWVSRARKKLRNDCAVRDMLNGGNDL